MTERRNILVGAGSMMAAAALLAGGMVGGSLPPEGLSYSAPTHEAPAPDAIGPRQKNRKIRERQNRSARRTRDAQAALKPRKLRRPDAYMRAVNRLTNWQRNQWARLGYPGSKKREVAKVEAFLALSFFTRPEYRTAAYERLKQGLA